MGYMGFGMRKADVERKPKKAFSKAKDLYGNKLENFPKSVELTGFVTTDFEELAQLRQRHEERFHLGAKIITFVFGVGIILMMALLYLKIITG